MLLHQTCGSPVLINLLISIAASLRIRKTNPAHFHFLLVQKPPTTLPDTYYSSIIIHGHWPKLSNGQAIQFLSFHTHLFHYNDQVTPFINPSLIYSLQYQSLNVTTSPNFLIEFSSSSFLLLFFPSKPSPQPISHSMATMKPKVPNHLSLKLIIPGLVLLFLILLLLRSSSSSPAPPSTLQSSQISPSNALPTTSCTKIPESLANTIIHYATSNTTPQQTFKEISVTARVLEKKAPCNFLIFGLGHDSPMWSALNHGGRTVFLEEDMSWMETIQQKFSTLESYHVTYDTKVTQADDLLELRREAECTAVGDMKFSKCQLALKRLPSVFFEAEWDLIMVDAPTGWIPEAPGRMGAIYTAGMAARARSEGETDVFVHDVDRVVEDKFSKIFLCEGYLKEQEGRLRHFTIPSHRTGLDMPFCP